MGKGSLEDFSGIAKALVILVALIVGYQLGSAREDAGDAMRKRSHSISAARSQLAAEATAALIEERLPTARVYRAREDLLAASLEAVEAPGGLYCEFGVATGSTINFMAEARPDLTFHGFDSFEGLPEDWRTGFSKGVFAMDALPAVRSNVKLYKGWFNESLPGFADSNREHVSFLHMDADLYSSTKTVFEALADRLRPGSVIQFDEYFNYPGWQRGEFQAFDELVADRGITYEYLGYCDGPREFEQVAVRILTIGNSARNDAGETAAKSTSDPG